LSARAQAKLLRLLEQKEYRRVGESRVRQADVRFVTASNVALAQRVAEGRFRPDLMYRLNRMVLTVPPLRERGDDVALLAEHFLSLLNKQEGTQKRLSAAAIDRITEHDWPGNVRELKNTIQRSFILADEELDLSGLIGQAHPAPRSQGPRGGRIEVEVGGSIADAERRLILATLEKVDGNKKQAAETLGISLKTLYNRLKDYEQGPES
jgi:DNA-binding NtrC family response regulator